MRLVVAVSLSVVLSATACTSTQTVEVGVGSEGEADLRSDGPVDSSSPSLRETTTSTVSTTTSPSTITAAPVLAATFSVPSDDKWEEHPAAAYVPDPALFGTGYEIDWVSVEEREPSDPNQMIEGCPVDPPPTMDGLTVDLSHRSDSAEAEVGIGVGDAEWAQQTVDAVRAVGSCTAEAIDVDEILVFEPETGADDAVILEISIATGYDVLRMRTVVARYGGTLITVYMAVVDSGPLEMPSVDDLSRWADTIAAQG